MAGLKREVLIVGGGPVGLTHAIELSRLGHKVRIIDKDPEPSPYSKAIAINPKSLSLLEASGASSKLIAEGVKISLMRLHNAKGKIISEVHIDLLRSLYPFMLALAQNRTESILTEVLSGFGVEIERGKEFLSCSQNEKGVIANISTSQGIETIQADYLVGADGAHSQVRKAIAIDFSGFSYEDAWSLADVTMDWNGGDANVYMLKKGVALIVIKIAKDRYRIIANHPNALGYLPSGAKVKEVFWQSDFKVSCRQVSAYQKGRVFLMGDAAHIHSPAGGRGMNLGIEDACVLASLLDSGKTDFYTKLRHPVGKEVIRLTSGLFKMVTLKNPFACVLRNFLLKYLLSRTFIQKKLVLKIAGLK